jgi:hypothetical protein
MKAFDHIDLILTYSASLFRPIIQVSAETCWVPAFAEMTEKNLNIEYKKENKDVAQSINSRRKQHNSGQA